MDIRAVSKIKTDPRWDAAFNLLGANDLKLTDDQQLDSIRMLYLSSMENIKNNGHITNDVQDVNRCITASIFITYLKKTRTHMVKWRKAIIQMFPDIVASFHDPLIELCTLTLAMLIQ
jgi:hypothetical protein